MGDERTIRLIRIYRDEFLAELLGKALVSLSIVFPQVFDVLVLPFSSAKTVITVLR